MKIAILGTRGIPARYGGFESFADRIAVLLAASGYDVTVFCPGESKADDYCGVRREFVQSPQVGPAMTIIYDLRCLLRARRYDVVYMLGYGTSLFCWIPRLFGAKVWINMDGLEWRRAKWGSLARGWLRVMEAVATLTANRLIVDSEAIGSDLRRRYSRLPKCSYAAYGADLAGRSVNPMTLEAMKLEAY